MAGFFSGVAEGIDQGQRLVQSHKRQKSLDAQEADRQKVRDLEASRQADLSGAIASGTEPARAGEEGPVPPKTRPIWDSIDQAAQARLSSGDMDGYEALAKRSVALKSLHYGSKLNQAALTGDPGQIAGVMNELSPGYKYTAALGQDGTVAGSVVGPDGNEVPLRFGSAREMAGMVQAFAAKGNVVATLQENEKNRVEALKTKAQTDQANASAENLRANADTERALLPGKVVHQDAQTVLTGAQTTNTIANAAKTAQDRQPALVQQVEALKKYGIPEEEALGFVMGKGEKGKSREQALIDVSAGIMKASASSLTGPMTAAQANAAALEIVDGAQSAGQGRVGSPQPGRGMNPAPRAPAAPTGKGMGAKPAAAVVPQLDPAEARRASEIKAAVRAGTMSREDARSELQALGFQ